MTSKDKSLKGFDEPTKYQLTRSGFVQLAEPVKVWIKKNTGMEDINAAMVAGNLVMELTPAVEKIVEEAIVREAAQ